MSRIEKILTDLVHFQSITPHDAGCQSYLIDFLTNLGFCCQTYQAPPVSNFFARLGDSAPLLMFAGHTDVVPPGDTTQWHTNPFLLSRQGDTLFGRGVADMKGSLAAMLIAAEKLAAYAPSLAGSLGFLITSGEEGDDFALGTPHVMTQLSQLGVQAAYCIVGEPSSTHRVGDVLKIGRRGSLTATIQVTGRQGHVAYPHLADNPIHRISPVLAELAATVWDEGNHYFPPTTMQITQIHAGGEANNIIPGTLSFTCNFRYSTEQTAQKLQNLVHDCLQRHGLDPQVSWRLNGEPFLTNQGLLLDSCVAAIQEISGEAPELSTSGGTSDGRFIAPYGTEVVELGPVNATIHQVNECVSLADLNTLAEIYYRICAKLLLPEEPGHTG